MKNLKIIFIGALFSFSSLNSFAQEVSCDLIFKGNKFESQTLKSVKSEDCAFELKSEKRNRILFCNQSEKLAELESHDLKIEKIISPNKSAIVNFKAVKKGEIYEFEEEFSKTECSFKGV